MWRNSFYAVENSLLTIRYKDDFECINKHKLDFKWLRKFVLIRPYLKIIRLFTE
jgi:hypothetical protein